MSEIVDGAVSLDFSVRATDEQIAALGAREAGQLGPDQLGEALGWLDVERRLVDRLLSNEGVLEHVVAERDALAAGIAAVLELHVPVGGHNPECYCGIPAYFGRSCAECLADWPCVTARILDRAVS